MKSIIHIDMDAFFVSVERLFDPSLIGKPVVVGGNLKRGVVAAASYEARKFGIHSGMPLSQARSLCSTAVFVRPRGRRYSEFSSRVMEILRDYSPLVEQVSVDEAYVDFTGCERLFGPVMKAASSIKREIFTEVGLPASMGISSNKLISKIASANFAKPNGIFFVPEGSEKEFLKPLSIKRLPGVGEHTREKFTSLGIFRIGDLAEFDSELVFRTFGRYGEYLLKAANGIHNGRVAVDEEDAKSIGKETTFDEDTLRIPFLNSVLFNLSEKVARKLRDENISTKTVTLKLRYSDFETVTRSTSLSEPTDRDDVVYSVARTQMMKLLIKRSRVKVRLLGVTASNFHKKDCQLALMDWERDAKYRSYYSAVDLIRERFGARSVFKSVTGDE